MKASEIQHQTWGHPSETRQRACLTSPRLDDDACSRSSRFGGYCPHVGDILMVASACRRLLCQDPPRVGAFLRGVESEVGGMDAATFPQPCLSQHLRSSWACENACRSAAGGWLGDGWRGRRNELTLGRRMSRLSGPAALPKLAASPGGGFDWRSGVPGSDNGVLSRPVNIACRHSLPRRRVASVRPKVRLS